MTSAPTHLQGSPMPTDAAQAEMILSQIESLPTLPAVAVRLIEVTGSDTSGAREVIQLVESDPSVASRILSLMNRAHHGVDVSTIDRAVVLLGLDAVRCLVLSMHVFEIFSEQGARSKGRLDVSGLWKHCLAVGCAARRLAEAWNRRPPAGGGGRLGAEARAAPQGRQDGRGTVKLEEAFLCGLLHDLGKVALHVCFPKSYDRVVQTVEMARSAILDEERQVFGLDHTTVGRRLAAHWKLPTMIGECIWLHHHDPTSTPTRIAFPQHVRLVQLADRLARRLHLGYSGNYLSEPVDEIAESLGFSPEAIDQIGASLPEAIEERAELIGLERLTSREVYHGALVQANAELAGIGTHLAGQQRVLVRQTRCLAALAAFSRGTEHEPTHEEIANAAALGLLQLYPGTNGAAVMISRVRGLAMIAPASELHSRRCDVRPLKPSETASGATASGAWVDAAILGPVWMDRLTGLLGEAPRWCWSVQQRQEWVGAFCLAGSADDAPDPEAGIDLLAGQTARWHSIAEGAAQSRLLHEEMADINRRLLSAQAQVAQMRSLAMVGEMAAGAAHELNNPLAVISGRAQLLDREGVSEEVRKNAGLITEHAHRASEIVTELMAFAKPPAPMPDAVELRELLGRIRRAWLARGDLTDAQFQLQVSDDLPMVWADSSQIAILFDEIIRNGVEAMGGSPQALLVVNCHAHPADEKVVVRVQDNGRGMSPDVLERAATPFYSSRPAGRGRGLGLSRAMRYAEINGGRIRLSSRPGQGTEVTIELPRAGSS